MSAALVPHALERWVDPAAVFEAFSSETEGVFWLDAGPDAAAGWSWVGSGTVEPEPARVRAVVCATPQSGDARSGPFTGGWVGWTGYERGAAAAGAPTIDDPLAPPEAWLRVRRFVAFDHGTRSAWAFDRPSAVAGLAARVAASVVPSPPPPPSPREAIARHLPGEYAELIERCRDAIAAGEAYQLCLTTRFSVPGEFDAAAVFRRLREATPAHHGGLVRSREATLASASPARFLRVSRGVATTSPVKGTRPRSADPELDALLADELQASAKERAENVMIVDLVRNDLSRVCVPGSIAVERLLEVESYPAVHQLVSTVSGRLRPDTTVGELMDATFPAGSMTGAPKLSAMSILHGLEGGPRGVFAGCFGWVGDDGALDLAMVIRSVVVHPRGAYVGAGGGITWRSEAGAEVAEVSLKARGPLAALGAGRPAGA